MAMYSIWTKEKGIARASRLLPEKNRRSSRCS
jgi:hypothetical protein